MMPPAPKRMELVLAPMCAIRTAGLEELIDGMLWCSVYHIRKYPSSSARCAKSTECWSDACGVSPSYIVQKDSTDSCAREMFFGSVIKIFSNNPFLVHKKSCQPGCGWQEANFA